MEYVGKEEEDEYIGASKKQVIFDSEKLNKELDKEEV